MRLVPSPIRVFFLLAIFSSISLGQAPTPKPETVQQSNLWLQGFVNVKLDKHWTIPVELQVRRARAGLTWQQFMVRVSLLREINPHLTVGGGYSFIDTWPYGKQPALAKFLEQRTFLQANLRHAVGTLPLEHRVRLEQRWIQRIDPVLRQTTGENIYTNRVRYRPSINIPLKHSDPARKGLGPGDTYLFVNDEIMFNFGKHVAQNTFDQNRFATGVGHNFSQGSIQVGYLHQYLQKGDGVRFESNHNITVALTYNLSVRH